MQMQNGLLILNDVQLYYAIQCRRLKQETNKRMNDSALILSAFENRLRAGLV